MPRLEEGGHLLDESWCVEVQLEERPKVQVDVDGKPQVGRGILKSRHRGLRRLGPQDLVGVEGGRRPVVLPGSTGANEQRPVLPVPA